jgi:glycosyltransferase involved in cell wall biosynthesis
LAQQRGVRMIEPGTPASASLFLTWIEHRRTREIAARLRMPLLALTTPHRGLVRYLPLAWRTIAALRRLRPRVVVVQSPSLILSLLALALRPLLRYALVVDAHNEAVEPYLHANALMRALTYRVLRRADLVVVSNSSLVARVEARGGRALSLPDCIPASPPGSSASTAGGFKVAVICTYAADEPVAAVIESARLMDPDVTFAITGDPDRLPTSLREALPANLRLTGFLSEVDYWSLLASSDVIMDLTTMDDCLVCGAYEGLAAGKPLLLSNNRASVELFHDAALFTDNSVESLVRTVMDARKQYPLLLARIPLARARIDALWTAAADALVAKLQRLAAASPARPPERLR